MVAPGHLHDRRVRQPRPQACPALGSGVGVLGAPRDEQRDAQRGYGLVADVRLRAIRAVPEAEGGPGRFGVVWGGLAPGGPGAAAAGASTAASE